MAVISFILYFVELLDVFPKKKQIRTLIITAFKFTNISLIDILKIFSVIKIITSRVSKNFKTSISFLLSWNVS